MLLQKKGCLLLLLDTWGAFLIKNHRSAPEIVACLPLRNSAAHASGSVHVIGLVVSDCLSVLLVPFDFPEIACREVSVVTENELEFVVAVDANSYSFLECLERIEANGGMA